ncbi:MAG: TatD family hydrolase [Alphaproteobacteria bacterium]|nr:TatD family hydrolase [Alphaproteobacteria bacterium]
MTDVPLMDTHCHLDPQTYGGDAGVDEVVARAHAAGVRFLVTIGAGYGVDCIERAQAVARRHPRVWFSAGLHPHDAVHWGPEVVARLRAAASDPRCVALGEMGLDFHYDKSPREAQRACLVAQIALARELDLPIVIHDRDTDGETLRTLQDEGAFEGRVLYHCYTGGLVHLAELVEAGAWISIPGIVTFKRAGELPAVAAAVPADRLLIETDSPFLTPEPFRGRRNEPALVVHTAEKVAALRGLTLPELARLTTANGLRFYGLGAVEAQA